MKRALVFGASGQVGDGLLPLLRDAGFDALGVSRQPHAVREGLHWIVGALDDGLAIPVQAFDVVFSLGPLDAFARWQERAGPVAPRVVAFGSTSIATKNESIDPHERDVVKRLHDAERRLFGFGTRHGIGVTVLRPTLVYGRGRDRTLSRIAAIARRFGGIVLPHDAKGLRQPVHVDDLARAALAASEADRIDGRAYDLPGGEALRFDDMVARVLAVLPGRPRALRLPSPLFRYAMSAARGVGLLDGVNRAMLARLDRDLVCDGTDARRDFGFTPRAFAPTPSMFPAGADRPGQ